MDNVFQIFQNNLNKTYFRAFILLIYSCLVSSQYDEFFKTLDVMTPAPKTIPAPSNSEQIPLRGTSLWDSTGTSFHATASSSSSFQTNEASSSSGFLGTSMFGEPLPTEPMKTGSEPGQGSFLPLADHSSQGTMADNPFSISDWGLPPISVDTHVYEEEPTAKPDAQTLLDGKAMALAILKGRMETWNWRRVLDNREPVKIGYRDHFYGVACCKRLPYICGVDGLCIIEANDCEAFCECAANPHALHCLKTIPRLKKTVAKLQNKMITQVSQERGIGISTKIETFLRRPDRTDVAEDGKSMALAVLDGRGKAWRWDDVLAKTPTKSTPFVGNTFYGLECCRRLPYICGVDGMCLLDTDDCEGFCECAFNPRTIHCVKTIPRLKRTVRQLEKDAIVLVSSEQQVPISQKVERILTRVIEDPTTTTTIPTTEMTSVTTTSRPTTTSRLNYNKRTTPKSPATSKQTPPSTSTIASTSAIPIIVPTSKASATTTTMISSSPTSSFSSVNASSPLISTSSKPPTTPINFVSTTFRFKQTISFPPTTTSYNSSMNFNKPSFTTAPVTQAKGSSTKNYRGERNEHRNVHRSSYPDIETTKSPSTLPKSESHDQKGVFSTTMHAATSHSIPTLRQTPLATTDIPQSIPTSLVMIVKTISPLKSSHQASLWNNVTAFTTYSPISSTTMPKSPTSTQNPQSHTYPRETSARPATTPFEDQTSLSSISTPPTPSSTPMVNSLGETLNLELEPVKNVTNQSCDRCEESGGICVMGNDFSAHCVKTLPGDACQQFQCIHGSCISTDGFYSCECFDGWTGTFCDKGCLLHCGNNGFCAEVDDGKDVACVCHWNYTGEFCDMERTIIPVITEVSMPGEDFKLWEVAVIGVVTATLLALFCILLPYCLWRRQWLPIKKLVFYFKDYEDDDGKEFDAFISYKSCPRDERFVLKHLYPKLEKELDFRLCMHFRDFPPGQPIANNIIYAIENSRRTILILSPSYVKSEWCRMEYQKAQHEMLRLKHKIIPIILEDIDGIPEMDKNLKTIIDTVTYIKWPGEVELSDSKRIQNFWKLLEMAMPKKRNEFDQSLSSSSDSALYERSFTGSSKTCFNSIVDSLSNFDEMSNTAFSAPSQSMGFKNDNIDIPVDNLSLLPSTKLPFYKNTPQSPYSNVIPYSIKRDPNQISWLSACEKNWSLSDDSAYLGSDDSKSNVNSWSRQGSFNDDTMSPELKLLSKGVCATIPSSLAMTYLTTSGVGNDNKDVHALDNSRHGVYETTTFIHSDSHTVQLKSVEDGGRK